MLAQNWVLRCGLVLLGLGLAYVLAPPAAFSQNGPPPSGTHGSRNIRAVRTETPLTVDGILDESAWQEARSSQPFIQKEPQEGQPSTEKTEFRVVYTASTLYIGVTCYDSDPDGIVASERRRDNTLENDDSVSLVLDTFHDHRNAYLFRTNPLGTQYDALVTNEGNSLNENWDEQWDVASRITPEGWTAEFAIPFKSLRVSEENGHAWGLDLERVIIRKNEDTFWNNYHRGFLLQHVSQAGHLEGIENIESGLRMRVKPFVVGGFRHRSSGSDSTFHDASDVGLEVLKYRLTPSLTADVTVNTDFAQTEVDDQQVNLGRFSLFFPEKREFFQEGAGAFETGTALTGKFNTDLRIFHSRTIGLSPKRRIVPITAGGRITGRVGRFTVGMLNVQTEGLGEAFDDQGSLVEGRIPASNYSVVRVKRDILERSSIGGFVLDRAIAGSSDFNRVYGVDANFAFFRHLTVGGQLGKSSSPGVDHDNWVSTGEVAWEGDLLALGTVWTVVDPQFRNDMGFIPRQDLRQFSPVISFRPRPHNNRLIRQFVFEMRGIYSYNQKMELDTKQNSYQLEIRFQDGGVFGWVPHVYLDRPSEPFHLRRGIVIPPGVNRWWANVLRYRSNPGKRFYFNYRWAQHYAYYGGGSLNEFKFEHRLRVTPQFSIEPIYDLNIASIKPGHYTDEEGNYPAHNGTFTDHVLNARFNYNFNNQWLTSTTVQYNNADSFGGFNFRLDYIYRPGDDLFVVYNEGRQAIYDSAGRQIAGVFDGRKDRSLQIKLTHSFDY